MTQLPAEFLHLSMSKSEMEETIKGLEKQASLTFSPIKKYNFRQQIAGIRADIEFLGRRSLRQPK